MWLKLLLLVFFLSPMVLMGQSALTKFQLNGLIGYKDENGKTLIDPQFNYGSNFVEGVAIVVVDRKRGLIDDQGNYLIKPKFEDLSSFSNGLAAAKLHEKYGFINKKGEWAIPAIYDEAYAFCEGFARVKSNEYFGYVNSELELIIPAVYHSAADFKMGKAAVQLVKGATYSYISTNGELAFDGMFEKAYTFLGEKAKVRLCGKWYSIDRNGTITEEIDERHEEH